MNVTLYDTDPETTVDRWTEDYNLDPDDDVAQDVVRHITNTVHAHLDSLGLLTGGPR